MPKSTTLTPSGTGIAASRRTTSTPNPSSAQKMLPMPATSTRRAGAFSTSPPYIRRMRRYRSMSAHCTAIKAAAPTTPTTATCPRVMTAPSSCSSCRFELLGTVIEEAPELGVERAGRVVVQHDGDQDPSLDVAIDAFHLCRASLDQQIDGIR